MTTRTTTEIHLAGRACRTSLIVCVGWAEESGHYMALLKQGTANADRPILRVVKTGRG